MPEVYALLLKLLSRHGNGDPATRREREIERERKGERGPPPTHQGNLVVTERNATPNATSPIMSSMRKQSSCESNRHLHNDHLPRHRHDPHRRTPLPSEPPTRATRALRHWCCRIPRHQTEVRADRHCDRWTDVRRDGTKQVWSTEIRSIRVWSHSNEYTMESNKICNACEAPLHHQTHGCFLPAALSGGSFWRLRTHFEGRHFLDVERRP